MRATQAITALLMLSRSKLSASNTSPTSLYLAQIIQSAPKAKGAASKVVSEAASVRLSKVRLDTGDLGGWLGWWKTLIASWWPQFADIYTTVDGVIQVMPLLCFSGWGRTMMSWLVRQWRTHMYSLVVETPNCGSGNSSFQYSGWELCGNVGFCDWVMCAFHLVCVWWHAEDYHNQS